MNLDLSLTGLSSEIDRACSLIDQQRATIADLTAALQSIAIAKGIDLSKTGQAVVSLRTIAVDALARVDA
jgi:hypothetical protein